MMSGELLDTEITFDTIDIKNDESSGSCREEDFNNIPQSQQQPQTINDKANNNGFVEEEDGDEIFRSSISNSTMSEATVSLMKIFFMGRWSGLDGQCRL